MSNGPPVPAASNTFERIKRVNPQGHDFWSARELARVLEYTDYRNFTAVVAKAREACLNSGHKVSDHFVDINEMVPIGSGAQRELEGWALSRYACYLVIQNADPGKPLVALGQTYFAVQTPRQELTDDEALKEDRTRLRLRAEIKKHNKALAGPGVRRLSLPRAMPFPEPRACRCSSFLAFSCLPEQFRFQH